MSNNVGLTLKILGFLALLWVLAFAARADAKNYDSYLYGEIYKDTNGSYIWAIPKLEFNQKDGMFIREQTLELDWTNPRSGALQIPNHYQVKAEYSVGFEVGQWFGTFGINGRYVFKGNDYGIPEGWYFGNTFRFGYIINK